MDGYIALYSAVSVLLIGRYYQERRSIDLLSAISCLVLMCNIKNEGILIGLLGAMSIIVTAMLSTTFKFRDFKNTLSAYRAGWLVLIISPGVLWSVVYKHKWHLMNDLQIGTLESVYRLSNRISDGVSFPLILKKTFFHSEKRAVVSSGLVFRMHHMACPFQKTYCKLDPRFLYRHGLLFLHSDHLSYNAARFNLASKHFSG